MIFRYYPEIHFYTIFEIQIHEKISFSNADFLKRSYTWIKKIYSKYRKEKMNIKRSGWGEIDLQEFFAFFSGAFFWFNPYIRWSPSLTEFCWVSLLIVILVSLDVSNSLGSSEVSSSKFTAIESFLLIFSAIFSDKCSSGVVWSRNRIFLVCPRFAW